MPCNSTSSPAAQVSPAGSALTGVIGSCTSRHAKLVPAGVATRRHAILRGAAPCVTFSSMNSEKLGDSYDIVKRALLCWLRDFGEWSVQPMFTDAVSVPDYEKLVGAR